MTDSPSERHIGDAAAGLELELTVEEIELLDFVASKPGEYRPTPLGSDRWETSWPPW